MLEQEVNLLSQNLQILMAELAACQKQCTRKDAVLSQYKRELLRVGSEFNRLVEAAESMSLTISTSSPLVTLHLSRQVVSNMAILLRHQHQFDIEREFRKLEEAIGLKRHPKDEERK